MSNNIIQLGLFDSNSKSDDKALPLIIAADFGFPLQSSVQNGTTYYVVLDWIRGITQTDNARRYLSDIKKRAKQVKVELYADCVQLPYVARDGKKYKVDFVTDFDLYRIAMRIPANTGIREEIIKYLAGAGVAIDQIRREPDLAIDLAIEAHTAKGKSREWSRGRVLSSITNKAMRQVSAENLDGQPDEYHYARLTNSGYRGAFGLDAQELGAVLGVPKDKKGKNKHTPLDSMGIHDLTLVTMYQNLTASKMQQVGRKLTSVEQSQLCLEIARHTRVSVEQVMIAVGLDPRQHLTGTPLLDE